MGQKEISAPEHPFLEKWAFKIKLLQKAGELNDPPPPPNDALNPMDIRERAIKVLDGIHSKDYTSYDELNIIRDAIMDVVSDGLSHPDYEYFVVEYDEHPGSWEITFLVVGAFYGGVCGYGAFRQGLEYVVKDLNTLFQLGQSITTRVTRRFKDRRELRPRIEPILNLDDSRSGKNRKNKKK